MLSSVDLAVRTIEKGFRGTVAIETHGCKLNQADSESLARRFTAAGYRVVDPGQPADFYILNTCTVTHVADRKARQALRAARHQNPSAFIVATGCYAERSPQGLSNMDGVNLVVGNPQKEQLVEMVIAAKGDQIVPCAAGEELTIFPGAFSRTRAMIKIQEGCNQVCAYCIVPKVRGREQSIPMETLLRQVQQRVKEGFKEVVLTGTQLGSYGFDLMNTNLTRLVDLILTKTEVERLRISSLQPQEITSDLLQLWSDTRLCPHFHIPLQSGSDAVLKRMRRRYTTGQYAEAVEKVRERVPCVSITADVIVGFPGETENDFHESLYFCEKMEFADMHVFPYSARPGTSAAFMGPKVEERLKRERMNKMLALAEKLARAFRRRFVGTIRPVLWEQSRQINGHSMYRGLTDNYLKVVTESVQPLTNQITPAQLINEQGDKLLAQVVEA